MRKILIYGTSGVISLTLLFVVANYVCELVALIFGFHAPSPYNVTFLK